MKQQQQADKDAQLYRKLLQHEARIGGELFGSVPAGGRREFFCLDERTWVWHEEWLDAQGRRQSRTTRYDVRPDGILKVQGGHYSKPNAEEVSRFKAAAKQYHQRVMSELYSFALQ